MLALICYLENKKRRASVVRNLRRYPWHLSCNIVEPKFDGL